MSPASNQSLPIGRPGAPRRGIVAAVALFALACTAAQGLDLRLATENDILNRSRGNDDLYTFSVALELQRDAYLFSLREHAFTDRMAGVRFDETWLTVKRAVPASGRFRVQVEAGVAHVGRGLFGEQAQNAVHRLIGDEELYLRYQPPSFHPALGLEVERSFALGRRFEMGPRFEALGAPGLRSEALLGVLARWRASRQLWVQLLGGARVSRADLPPLEPHLAAFAPVARVGVVLHDTFVLSWSHNAFGDGREHVSLEYWVPLGERGPADPARHRARKPLEP